MASIFSSEEHNLSKNYKNAFAKHTDVLRVNICITYPTKQLISDYDLLNVRMLLIILKY
jgi:hypothetical protein